MCVRIHTGAICMQNCFSETNDMSSYKFVNDSVSSVQQQLLKMSMDDVTAKRFLKSLHKTSSRRTHLYGF